MHGYAALQPNRFDRGDVHTMTKGIAGASRRRPYRARVTGRMGVRHPPPLNMENLNFEAAILNVSLLWILTTPHEFAHAWVATKLGDDTPEREGRVTLNPLAHVDWLGTTILPALTSLLGGGFIGWGKPVNTNPARLRWGLNGLALVA